MYLPTPTTLNINPTSLTQHLTTPVTPTTLTTQETPNPFSISTPPTTTTEPTDPRPTRRRIIWQTPNVVMDDIPTTLVTVTMTAHATTRWVTLPAESKSAATAAATNGLLAATTATQTPAELGEGSVGEGIPDWPPLMVIFLLCWVVVAWIVAGVLYLATFTEQVAGLDRLLGKWRVGRHGKRRRHFTGQAPSEQAAGATATGLGISFATERNPPRLRRPRSFDSDSFGIRDSRALYGGSAATAPLPSSGSFKMLSPDPSPTHSDSEGDNRQEGLESGERGVRGCGGTFRDEEQQETGGIAGVLESVNVLIDFVARNLARMASDRVVDDAEQGLLLPVREEEREPVGVVV